MRPLTWKLIGVAVAVRGGRRSRRPLRLEADEGGGLPVVHVPGADANGHPVVNLTIETVAAVGPQLSPAHPDYVSYLDPEHAGQVGARHRLAAACARDRARDHLQLRRRQRPAQPASSRGRRASTATRSPSTASRRTSSTPDDASHTFAVPAYRTDRRRSPVSPTTRRTSAATRPARCRRPPHDHVHLPHRQGRATTAGSASCRARPAGSYGFGGPMQTIGYMDGFLERRLSDVAELAPRPRNRRAWIVAEPDRDAARRDLPRPAIPPGNGSVQATRPGRSTTR